MRGVSKIFDPCHLALVYAPTGRDAQIAASLLTEAGIHSKSVETISGMVSALDDDVAFVVVTEETLRSTDLRPLSDWIGNQPAWSDLPFIVLTHRGGGPERNPAALRLSEILGNVSFVERPFHATTFISVSRTAFRNRLRQFDARSQIGALADSELWLQTALSAGRLGSWELDLASKTLVCSDTCKSIFGYPPEARFEYEDLLESVHPDDRERMRAAVADTIENGKEYSIEYRIVWPDRSVHWAEIKAQLYRDRRGVAIKMVGVSADITARKEAAEKQRLENETLELRVAERTAELLQAHEKVMAEVEQRQKAEEQLRQALKMEAIGQLTGGVAHDFNNLLMAVMGNLELLAKHVPYDEKAMRLIDGALKGAKRGASLTQRLLAFARRQDLQVKPVNMLRLIEDMDDLLRRSAGSNIALNRSLGTDLPFALGDANQIELALLNLVVNARDAMREGGTISIGLREDKLQRSTPELAAGDYVVLSVTDTGTGMDAETLKKAIDPFFSTKELGKGTGLGLSMIHGLALQLKGALVLQSTLGKGTTAELWIPVSDDEANDKQQAMPVETPQTSSTDRQLRILMVDDDALIAMSSVDMLEDLGHEVVEASSGKQALEILANAAPFDLLVTDFSMPGMNGAELSRKARELVPNLPILIATGYADLPDGMDLEISRLGKPYTQDQLASEISKVLATNVG
ncbi:hybrid sensor histidine kinase/response regulator [Agrobacterium rosae]|uniref:hybrid sensor histidine kinase/response regulator n=1 Tax=Agrobacterium rosae TaxID=1972867 RepID=UPI00097265EB|nr:hybrid sensor histidine kinase/response regulator [Agrobacterium sp. DSM 25558]SCX08186.1 Blue-light-activated protein [Agrobacterium sp. DSM 25558]